MAFIWAFFLAIIVAQCEDSHGHELANTLFDKEMRYNKQTDLDQSDFAEVGDFAEDEAFAEDDAAANRRIRRARGYGASYIRWGKASCPSTFGTSLVYSGYVGGSLFTEKGGGSNYLCLSRNPIYNKYTSGDQDARARLYGAEYETHSGIYPDDLNEQDVPCAVCYVRQRASQIMIPGSNACPAGWRLEYQGYLMASKYTHYRSMFTCVDEDPDYITGGAANENGAMFVFVDGKCGSLPCPPYVGGRELTCAVCTRLV